MRAPCVRIQLDYADGTQQFAFGENAEVVIRYWEECQRVASKIIGNPAPQLETLPATMTPERVQQWMSGAPGDKNRVDIPINKVIHKEPQ